MGILRIEPEIFCGEVPPSKAVLQVLLENGARVHYACRRGLCGQDLIRITAGWEYLNPISDLEEGTLQMLGGLGKSMRMACCTRVVGDGEVVVEVV